MFSGALAFIQGKQLPSVDENQKYERGESNQNSGVGQLGHELKLSIKHHKVEWSSGVILCRFTTMNDPSHMTW